MKYPYKTLCLILLIPFCLATLPGLSQQHEVDPEYWDVVMSRSALIVANLDLGDAAQAERVQKTIAAFYADLAWIHDNRDAAVDSIGKAVAESEAMIHPAVDVLERGAQIEIEKIRRAFIGELSAELTPEQVVQVKDGLTYGVVPITLGAYRKMLPEMTPEESRQLEAWMVEAREYAMVAGSSHAKHGWFGKYKGKITNYLSKRGYDLKKAEQRLYEED